jgi:hypothetical protein
MLTRLFAVAIATAIVLLTGCQTLTTEGYVSPDKRDQTLFECPDISECYVQVDPYKQQWVPENISVYKGKKIALWLNNTGEFEDPPVTPKPGEPPILDCSEKNKLIVKCKVSNDADPKRKYGYTIHVKDKPAYDPFVWPR